MRRWISLTLSVLLLLTSCRAAGLPGTLYLDVPDDHWAISELARAQEIGLMVGDGTGNFGLGESLTRGSFLTMLCRLFAWEMQTPESPSFADCSSDAWYYSAVETAYANGAISYAESVRPDENITRLEMAQMLVSALDYDALAAQVTSSPFADITSGVTTLAYHFGMIKGVQMGDALYFYPERSASREEACAMMMRVYDRYCARLEWLHGFYALSSSTQMHLATQMDGVSFGWSRLAFDEEGVPYMLSERVNGNEWIVPQGADWAKETLDAAAVPYNLNVYASIWSGGLVEMLQEEAQMQTAVAAIAQASEPYAGITIDFEGLSETYRAQFSAFMQALRAALPAEKTLYVCVMPTNYFGGYDFRALGEVCDKVIMMAHDYVPSSIPAHYIGTDKTNYPEAPIAQVYRALAALTDAETGVQDLNKCALAISIAATAFPVDEAGLLRDTKFYTPNITTMERRLRQDAEAIGWSDTYRSPYLMYQNEDGEWFKAWYEDARSVTEKIKLARMFGINGISFWRLGEIPEVQEEELHYNVWDATMAQR